MDPALVGIDNDLDFQRNRQLARRKRLAVAKADMHRHEVLAIIRIIPFQDTGAEGKGGRTAVFEFMVGADFQEGGEACTILSLSERDRQV